MGFFLDMFQVLWSFSRERPFGWSLCTNLLIVPIFMMSLSGHFIDPCFGSSSNSNYKHFIFLFIRNSLKYSFLWLYSFHPRLTLISTYHQKTPTFFLKRVQISVMALFINRYCMHWYCWCCSGIVLSSSSLHNQLKHCYETS